MESIGDFVILVAITATFVWALRAQRRRIKRENAEAFAEYERQLRQAHENGRRGLPFIPQPKPERRSAKD